jgi:hypothetical protein
MDKQNKLYKFDKKLKNFLATFVIVLTIGVTVGLVYLNFTTNMSSKGTVERYNGSQIDPEGFEIAEKYPKPISEMLLTTHNHIISFSFIFGLLGIIFYFNSVLDGFWKEFLIIEPFISTLITFSSIWGIRYIDERFVYLTIISATIMYISFYLMSAISLYELIFKKNAKE